MTADEIAAMQADVMMGDHTLWQSSKVLEHITAQAAEIARMAEINSKFCADFNLMNQYGARQDAEIAELRVDYEGMKLEAFHRGQEVASRAAEIARLGGLMSERMQMFERYGAMVDEAMAREDIWKARTASVSTEVKRLEVALAVYACRCIGPLPDCAQGDIAGCGWTARAALETKS